MSELERRLEALLSMAERDLTRACAEFDVLVAWHGPRPLAQALQAVAGDELATLTRPR